MKNDTTPPSTPDAPSFDESGTSIKASTAGAIMILAGAVGAFILMLAGAIGMFI